VPVPVDLHAVLLTALLNPVVAIVAFWMGASADQRQKLPLAAFVAAFAGTAALYLAIWLGVAALARTARALGGIFVAQFLLGLAWAYAGHRLARRAP
jgi:hypothetical protein